MKTSLLKISYAIEIGAYLAYVGHYKVSDNKEIRRIAREELRHMIFLKRMMSDYGTQPSRIFNTLFLIIGHSIRLMCPLFPMKILNKVASMLEIFNVVNYHYMAKLFPRYKDTFIEMEQNEEEHKIYFSRL